MKKIVLAMLLLACPVFAYADSIAQTKKTCVNYAKSTLANPDRAKASDFQAPNSGLITFVLVGENAYGALVPAYITCVAANGHVFSYQKTTDREIFDIFRQQNHMHPVK